MWLPEPAPAVAAAASAPGGELGRYRILTRLGCGGMGEVFLANDPALRRGVAIKRILPRVPVRDAAQAFDGGHCRQLWPARRQRPRHVLARPRHPGGDGPTASITLSSPAVQHHPGCRHA